MVNVTFSYDAVPAGNPMIVFASCDVSPEALAPTHHRRTLSPQAKWPKPEADQSPNLTMSGVMPPLPMYAVTIRTGSTIFHVAGGDVRK